MVLFSNYNYFIDFFPSPLGELKHMNDLEAVCTLSQSQDATIMWTAFKKSHNYRYSLVFKHHFDDKRTCT
jgi:hypothetical protein